MLELQNLSIMYNSRRPYIQAVNSLNLVLAQHENLGIIGESGCGKTTLALSIMGLCKNADISGRILFKGQELTRMGERALRRIRWKKIAMVFQNALEVFNPVLSVGEQIAEPMRAHFNLSAAEADIRVAELFELIGLKSSWRSHYPHQLSGGMRQRALIAMALSCNPEILIVDEPFTALDAESRHTVVHLLQALQERMGFAMILISHSLPAIQQLTSRVITMYAGLAVEQGRTKEVLSNPLHPYTRGLINAAPEFFQYKDLWGIGGEPPVSGTTAGCPFQPRCVQDDDICRISRPSLCQVGIERLVACHKGGIETILKARGIKKTYPLHNSTITALNDVDITIKSGEVVALVGSSGSGKSTLAHILVHILSSDAGEVYFTGKKVVGKEMTSCMGGMQIVFQDPSEAVSPRLTVLDAVREPLDVMRYQDRPWRDQKAIDAIRAVHLPTTPDFLYRTCHALSGGQRQRLSVARAMATDPILLIADEITAMLDSSTQATLLRELKGLQNRQGFSMLFITHDIHLARKVADRVYVLENGCVVEHGAAFEVFDHPRDFHTHRLVDAAFDHDRSIVGNSIHESKKLLVK